MKLLKLLKRIPVDLGQATLRTKTKGKLIALSLVPDGHGRRALDVGCREGEQTRWLRNRGYEVTSIDIERAFEDCIVVDVDDGLPFPDESFDLIWCSEVIEHLKSPTHFVSEAHRVLNRNGRLIVTTPNSAFWLYWVTRLLGIRPAQLQNPTHRHFFSHADIKRIFNGDSIFGFFPYFLIRKTIRSGLGPLSPTFVIESKKRQ
jgi:2-polyprenyl-3-methyl-5-hydroxy-6-metoxy-1,4-benzoquinol methylase